MNANLYDMTVGLKTFVTAGIPAKLRLIELELADGVALPDPKLHVLGYRDLFTSTDYPLLCYIAASMTAEDGAMHGEWLNLNVSVLASFVHAKPEVLEKIILRYADAFMNLIGSDESIGGVCHTSRLTDIDWGHPGGDDKSHGVIALNVFMQKEIVT